MSQNKKPWHQNWKTIAGSIALAALAVSYSLGWIDEKMAIGVGGFIGGLTGVSMRLGLKRVQQAVEQVDAKKRP